MTSPSLQVGDRVIIKCESGEIEAWYAGPHGCLHGCPMADGRHEFYSIKYKDRILIRANQIKRRVRRA